MKIKLPFQDGSLRSLLSSVGIVFAIMLTTAIAYFYVYLPNITNHGESITVPDVQGMKIEEVSNYLPDHDLRFVVTDSAYSDKFPPLAVLRQFPKEGAKVKKGRIIYLSVNRITPPTLPLPDLKDISLKDAELNLKSNELQRGRVYYRASPFMNLVIEMRFEGKVIEPETRVPKGAVIDLVVGDGNGPADFIMDKLVGDTYKMALFKLSGWNLHLGNVEIPADADTTGGEAFVFKQSPAPGDSIRVGAPVDLWIAPRGYKSDTDDSGTNN